jgi:hypothetical protein
MIAPDPFRRFHLVLTELSVAVSCLIVLAVLAHSTNSPGHRVKALLLLAAGGVFFVLALLRLRAASGPDATDATPARTLFNGLVYFGAFAVAAVLTLTLDFALPVQRWVGVGSQVVAGVVGLVGCIQYIKAS